MNGRNSLNMKCLVCAIVVWCMLFNVVIGQLNGDPAPGRSPGPPSASDATSANTIWTQHNGNHNRNDMNEMVVDNDRTDGNDDIQHHQMPRKPVISKPQRQPDKLVDKLTNEFVNHKPCKNVSVSEYLSMNKQSLEIVKVNNRTSSSSSSSSMPAVNIDVVHNTFDLNYGLVRNVIYTVRLFLPRNESIIDFYVESLIDGVKSGMFRSETTTHASATEMASRKHKLHKSMTDHVARDESRRKPFTSHAHAIGSTRIVDESGYQLPNDFGRRTQIVQQTAQTTTASPPNDDNSRIGYTSGSVLRRNKRIKMSNYHVEHCNQDFWSETISNGANGATELLVRKWSFNGKMDIKNKTVSFRILYRKNDSSNVYEQTIMYKLRQDCILYIRNAYGTFDYSEMPEFKYDTCIVYFPSRDIVATTTSATMTESPGLLIEMTRLNVPCDSGGYLIFTEQTLLCGKLEDLATIERIYYYASHVNTSVVLHKSPLFSLNYKLVDYCYNVSLTTRNDSILLEPQHSLECFFKIHLPYGNVIELNLFANYYTQTNDILQRRTDAATRAVDDIDHELVDLMAPHHLLRGGQCVGILVRLDDPNAARNWTHCVRSESEAKKFTFKSTGNALFVYVTTRTTEATATVSSSDFGEAERMPSIFFEYRAVTVPEIVSQCAFGWIAVHQFCITAIEIALTWHRAEEECKKRGGHLASIKSEREQKLIDTLLMNSATFKERAAYWVGASDDVFEGDFRWTNGLPYTYSNWFPGWIEHNHYNKQPNDDGLSGQDCVELRRYFRVPPSVQSKPKTVPLTTTYMWNDRNCNEQNYFLCERPMSDEPIEKSWTMDCNKTIILSHNHLRASVWSPGFGSGNYPDRTNCFTVIIAPKGHYIAIEFEEFVMENEPQCTYDYLEIIDSHPIEYNNRNREFNVTQSNSSAPRQSHGTPDSTAPAVDSNITVATKDIDIFENFLSIYRTHRTYLIQTPDTASMYYEHAANNGPTAPRRICGDWNSKVKLLRYRSSGPIMGLHFSSDYSHHFSGYKAKVVIKNAASKCSDDRLKPYNGSCYLFVSYPEVDWMTAQQICAGLHGELTTVTTAEEQRFIITNLRNELDYSPQTIYWLGGKLEANKHLKWIDGSNITYKGWIQGQRNNEKTSREAMCLGLQWKVSSSPLQQTGVFWTTDHCARFGGYICKKRNQNYVHMNVVNRTITGTDGHLSSPNFPNLYPPNTNYWTKLISPDKTRLVIEFSKIDLEEQNDCLYDFLSIEDDESYENNLETVVSPLSSLTAAVVGSNEIDNFIDDDYANENGDDRHWRRRKRSSSSGSTQSSSAKRRIVSEPSFLPYVRWCGTHESNMTRFNFVSASNMVLINFHSDYSVSGSGYALTWRAVPLDGCPTKTYTSIDDVNSISSPNFPHALLNNLNCTYFIYAAVGRKILLEFHSFDLVRDSHLEIDLGHGPFVPFQKSRQLNDGIFVSYQNRISVRFVTGAKPKGNGFLFTYKTYGHMEQRSIVLSNRTNGVLNHLNYPQTLPSNIDFSQHVVVPLGDVILLEIYNVGISESGCHSGSRIEIYDNYADINGSYWNLCKLSSMEENYNAGALISFTTIHITSYLNAIHIRQKTTESNHLTLNATVRIQPDFNYKYKLATGNDEVESCEPNPCQNDGKCISSGNLNRCQCVGHFAGRFCALTMCEMEPCIFGKCELTSNAFTCHCLQGYVGRTCDQKQKPCADNPCESRGECFEKNGKFHCRCHAWWEGARCERRMMRIPYKPLSERMLQEPFWLGLITVFVVLAFIGLVWCAKRHFPEKIEKLLTEETDRSRPAAHGSMHHLHNHHHPSLREQLNFNIPNSAPQSTATTPGTARTTIFGRLGIRKPSILSLSSQYAPNGGATARTFSLDDLLRPPPRRTPSPSRKKRNNSTPIKSKAHEKQLILETLIAPASIDTRPKSTSNLKSLSLPSASTELIPRPSSVPPTPIANDTRSPHSTSSNQGSDSLSGSELTIHDISMRLLSGAGGGGGGGMGTSSGGGSMTGNGRRIKPKVSSADSILAMFRNFASTNVISQMPSSLIISPSTTPSASSPQDVADDDSSTSSMHTPISYTSCAPDSPISYHLPNVTIEVPVLDPLNAHKSTSGASQTTSTNNATSNLLNPNPTILLEVPSSNANKCLSPIRELPTPIPSPALTPIMPRQQRFTGFVKTHSYNNNDTTFSTSFSDDDERLSIEQMALQQKSSKKTRGSGGMNEMCNDAHCPDIGIPNRNMPHILRPIPTRPTLAPAIFIDIQPPTPEDRSPNRPKDLIIPQLFVQTPSPTRERIPAKFLGSPPPQRSSAMNEITICVTDEDASDAQLPSQKMSSTNKPASFELPFKPPTITINAIMTEMESDTDTMSPATTKSGNHLLLPRSDMCYLSPFSSVGRGDRTISESNLSSSGYSSMASPAPSRCGSSNPLYPNDMDDGGCGPSGQNSKLHKMISMRRSSSHGKQCEGEVGEAAHGGDCTDCVTSPHAPEHRHGRQHRSYSETFSDDILLESNDEGIGTDHIDDKIEEGEIRSAKELEHYIGKELLDSGKKIMGDEQTAMSQLQLPTIVIQTDGSEKVLSPVSSRSESPISERATGMSSFSPLFYNRKDQTLPFTDSDGLYDFPSSDGRGNPIKMQNVKKNNVKRRDRKLSRGATIPSPAKCSILLDLPIKESSTTNAHAQSTSRSHNNSVRKSPKRRPMQRHAIISSSSSTESLTSSTKARYGIILKGKTVKRSDCETEKEVVKHILPKACSEYVKSGRKINRLKAISNQIRFLRRLEQSIKERAKRKDSILTSDSYADDDDDGDDANESNYADTARGNQAKPDQNELDAKRSNDTTLSATTIVTKNKRSQSLQTQHEIRKVFVDSFYENEATSD